ncbi:MAG: hypothetical protein GY809_23935 [Planctomycetes bacterium]|nr:hypothetical protein [Planctomycetota bacterium]
MGKDELYHVGTDPGERNSLAKEHPGVVHDMLKAYDAWWDEVRPMSVNEDAALATGKPLRERFERQK